MSPDEYEQYYAEQPEEKGYLRAEEIPGVPEGGKVRILLHGYEFDRSNFFVGIRYNVENGDAEIGRAVDAPHGLVWVWHEQWLPSQLNPRKRFYPERTDYVFASMLRDRLREDMAPMLPYDSEWAGWDYSRMPSDHNPGNPWSKRDCEYAEGTKIR